jgi:hypothetical protein
MVKRKWDANEYLNDLKMSIEWIFINEKEKIQKKIFFVLTTSF